MNRSLALLGVGLILGGLTGFMFAAAYGITLDGHEHDYNLKTGASDAMPAGRKHEGHGSHADHDQMISLPAGSAAPTLDVSLSADPAAGWNLHVVTTNFRFAPENAGRAHVTGEGHAHVYVNGTKIARQYGPWLHIAKLPAGRNVVAVTLNANDHRLLGVGSTPLRVEKAVAVE